ncbi:MAG TPA: 50S ribosomal protein L4 [Candidatus Babeliales bacterium]|jgi:large subunit ribosomal protein L4|nr:50S ribosomal protein L4 [Candidatus Babeliales bacterium]
MSNKQTVNNSVTNKLHAIAAQELDFDTTTFVKATPASFSTWIRVLAQNWRQGTLACQGRADVSHTNRKPYKQKGTGRARAGSSRSPLWKGGGVIFGPQARVRAVTMPRQMKRKVLLTMLANNLDQKNVICADWELSSEQPKTAQAQELVNSVGLANKKIILFVAPYDFHSALSFANIPNVRPLSFDQANAYDLANSDCWLFLKKDLDHFKGMVSQWI